MNLTKSTCLDIKWEHIPGHMVCAILGHQVRYTYLICYELNDIIQFFFLYS
jgi:hypothetical protein